MADAMLAVSVEKQGSDECPAQNADLSLRKPSRGRMVMRKKPDDAR
jgi:hypothetical protein